MTVRRLLLGGWLGLLVLGIGGRLVMRAIALATGAPPAFNLGGTLTVVGSGIAAGVAGAVLYTASDAVARRVPRAQRVVRGGLFVLLLALVTMRGLQGTPPGPSAAFWPLVAVYAALFLVLARRDDAATVAGSGRRWPLRFNRAPGNVR